MADPTSVTLFCETTERGGREYISGHNLTTRKGKTDPALHTEIKEESGDAGSFKLT